MMKHHNCLLSLLILWITACHTQSKETPTSRGEFGPTANGLLYPAQTMSQLRPIVDSLNFQHMMCVLHPTYRSLRQGQAQYVRLEKTNLKQARQALEQGISPEAFAARFPQATLAKDLLIISYEEKWKEPNGNEQANTMYRSIPLPGQIEYFMRIEGATPKQCPEHGRWIVRSEEQTSYSAAYVEAFFLPNNLTQTALPARYANLVQYADRLIDTTTQIYSEAARRNSRRYRAESPKTQTAFLDYAHQQTKRPSTDYDEHWTEAKNEAYQRAYREWDSLRIKKLDRLANTPKFRQLLVQAATDTSCLGATYDEFEEYVARYYSPQKALELKRSRIVVGTCSQDDSPRRHALAIAQLSAQTVNWETFLRAHLDIMNDRFERASDGSYAWAARKTYLRELEELHINVPDLLLGISLRIDNPSRYHYFGSLGRLGRALAETRQPRELEQRLLALVADPGLDTYNRVLAYYLFLNYNSYLEDETIQKRNVTKLNVAVQQLPAYLVARAVVKADE